MSSSENSCCLCSRQLLTAEDRLAAAALDFEEVAALKFLSNQTKQDEADQSWVKLKLYRSYKFLYHSNFIGRL